MRGVLVGVRPQGEEGIATEKIKRGRIAAEGARIGSTGVALDLAFSRVDASGAPQKRRARSEHERRDEGEDGAYFLPLSGIQIDRTKDMHKAHDD